jgi:hypothetical protein
MGPIVIVELSVVACAAAVAFPQLMQEIKIARSIDKAHKATINLGISLVSRCILNSVPKRLNTTVLGSEGCVQ